MTFKQPLFSLYHVLPSTWHATLQGVHLKKADSDQGKNVCRII